MNNELIINILFAVVFVAVVVMVVAALQLKK